MERWEQATTGAAAWSARASGLTQPSLLLSHSDTQGDATACQGPLVSAGAAPANDKRPAVAQVEFSVTLLEGATTGATTGSCVQNLNCCRC